MKRFLFSFILLVLLNSSFAQYKSNLSENNWVDSVFNSLNKEERIAQLIVIRAYSNDTGILKTADLVSKYNVGALCFFQGGPVRQANSTNYYQSISKTPLLVTIDAEWGLGMRLDSITKFPYQLSLGAINDPSLIYELGKAVGEQCKRIGVQVNYAPVVDINNNPNNPVIGYRSFGEDKNKVTEFGLAYMKGMQDVGIMACAKHFPGHGDVDVDSHLDLPVINKSIEQLDSVELKPFKALFNAGVGSVMMAHLYIPSIDSTTNLATSLSKNNVTGLLRKDLGYKGLTFTDALEMKGVAKYWPGGEAAVQALIAGNDMLCLPESVPEAIIAVEKAISEKRLKWSNIDNKLKKVLHAKYQLGLHQLTPVNTNNLTSDLNAKTDAIRNKMARQAITLLSNQSGNIVLSKNKKIAYVGIGSGQLNSFGNRLKQDWSADVFLFSYKDTTTREDSILQAIHSGNYDNIVLSVSDYNLRPANNYNISNAAADLFNRLQSFNSTSFIFGNVLAIKNFCSAKNLVACYQDDDLTQQTAADILAGAVSAQGHLPVSICDYNYGAGIIRQPQPFLASSSKFYQVDSIVNDALEKKAFPGCVVLAAKDGKIVYEKAFGHYNSDSSSPVINLESIFDLASVTKVSATTISVMKLYEQGKLDLDKTIGDYLPWTKGTDKAHLKIHDILLHQAGLVPFIPFYKETIDTATGVPNPAIYSNKEKPGFTIRVAENLYLRNDWEDTIFQRILKSPLGPPNKYVYSDNDFIFLGKIVEAISGMPLDQYAQKTFYSRLGLVTTGFKPRKHFSLNQIVPTENESNHFRRQLIWGDVHDEGASMFGGVAGHAGLFSDAYDLGMLYQMLLNGGNLNGERYLKPETIKLFTAYQTDVSRRGYGFDKPEKDNATRTDPYPSALASQETFGHTGFTGTCVWVDPKYNIVYIFLSNRVNPTRDNNKISEMRIRGKIQDAIYRVLSN
jgi:beta-glucosidase-like glycosyl hydrolase/CubicO group peptidase (beta-lactamase class C family)